MATATKNLFFPTQYDLVTLYNTSLNALEDMKDEDDSQKTFLPAMLHNKNFATFAKLITKLADEGIFPQGVKATVETAEAVSKIGGGWIPLIGVFLSAPYAYHHYQKGEYWKMGFEMLSGTAYFIPGGGTICSVIIDAAMGIYDNYSEANKKKESKEKLDWKINEVETCFENIVTKHGCVIKNSKICEVKKEVNFLV